MVTTKVRLISSLLFFGFLGIVTVFWDQKQLIVKNTDNADLQAVIQESAESVSPQQTNFLTLEKIREGQERLKKSPPLRFEEKTAIKELLKSEIELSILDLETGKIFEKRFWLNQEEVEKANNIRRHYLENPDNLPSFISEDPTEDFQVTVNWWNNFNSDLSIASLKSLEEKNRYIVIGNKFLLGNDNFAYFSEQTGDDYSDMVYAPYSLVLRQPEFVSVGREFLSEKVSSAFQKLRELGVKSTAFPGQLVADTMEEEFVRNILLVEQTDPSMFLLSGDGGLNLVERVFVRLALNGEKAFRYTFSKTGASGLGQIMPKTYSSTVNIYPEAKLITDQNIGRIDIKNGIMASILVFDSHLGDVLKNLTTRDQDRLDKKLVSAPEFLNEMRAAIYNGGPRKYEPATATISSAVTETVLFIKKYKMIRDLELF